MSGRRQDWPRFARADVRSFAEELARAGWEYDGIDASGHTIWTHSRASRRYKLPSTPSHFSIQRARRDAMRLLGQKPAGKRKGKASVKAPRQDFALQQAQRQADRDRRDRLAAVTTASPRADLPDPRDVATTLASYRRERFITDLMRPGA